METSNWRVFVTVAERGSLSAAADELNLSQSGVSYSVKSLEDRTGCPLFVRHRRGVALTEPGSALLPLAHALLNQEERLAQGIAHLNGLAAGTVRVGTYASAAATWLPQVLARFRKRYPNIDVELAEGAAEEIEANLAGNAVDFAITSFRERSGFEWIDLEIDRLVAVSRTDGSDTDASPFPLSTAGDTPLIVASTFYEHDVSQVLSSLGVQPSRVSLRSRDDRTIMELARAGLGTALLFQRVVEAGGTEGLVVRRTEPAVARRVGIAIRSRAGASPAAQALVRAIVKSFKKA